MPSETAAAPVTVVTDIKAHCGWSVICPFACQYIIALNETCLGDMVFLTEASCWDSTVQKGQILCSSNTVHWGSGSQNDPFIHKQSIYHH